MPRHKPSDEPSWIHTDDAERPAWSPPVPPFHDEPWRGQIPMTEAEVEPYLQELRKAAEARLDERHRLPTAEQTATYLAACRAKGISTAPLEALGPIKEPSRPADLPKIVKHMTAERRAFKRTLAQMFPVTEAEEQAARRP